ncbi:MAG: ATP-binding protein [Thermodesulfobacteriota bacterium]|nr:MAG: ATP-binding protein [Thermodesulfobacteriota bacterium]
MNLNFLKLLSEKFSVKVFVTFTVFLFIIFSSFTVFFYYQQSKALTNTLIRNSELLVGVLAYSVRLGVISENQDLLQVAVEGIFQQENVLEISVFNLQKNLLKRLKKYKVTDQQTSAREDEKVPGNVIANFRQDQPLVLLKGKDSMELWSPVITTPGYSSEEDLVLGERNLKKRELIIGAAKITIDKSGLKKRLDGLLLKSVLMGFVFWGIGSLLIFIMTRQITTPLKRLTTGVYTLGIGGVVSEVVVETGDEIGKLADAFNTMLDALKKREAEKEQLQEQLRHSQKMEAIGTLAGGIAHDFNNILTAIMGFGGLIQMKIPKESPISSHVEQILESAQKAASLTKNLLVFSRKQLSAPAPLNLNESISNLKKLLGRLIKEDIEFKVELGKNDLVVMADQGQLDQIFMNLVTNARDAMPKGGVLTISTGAAQLPPHIVDPSQPKKLGGYALISVSDTGIGIDEKTQEKIFDPFFTTKEVGKGTGLGLSMIYGIVKKHDGYIDVASEVGKGTTFNIYLPLIDSTFEKQKEKASRPLKRGTETILVADDDPAVASLVKRILEEFGYKVIEARDGEDAIEQFLKHKDDIHLLLLDVIMPKKNGKEAFDGIRKIKPEIKAIFISGYSAEIIDEQAILQGLHFIGKPVSPEELLYKVREILDN